MEKRCSFCGKELKPSDQYIDFKDGQMCIDCAIKQEICNEKGMLSINDTIYCKDHTIEEFKNSDKYKGPKKNDSSDLTTTCSICNKSISVNDVALTFKDGRMCDDCAKKYNLLEQDGFPTAKAMKYCNSHTVDDFKNWIKASTELGATQSQNQSQEANVQQPQAAHPTKVQNKQAPIPHPTRTQHKEMESDQPKKKKHSLFYYVGTTFVWAFWIIVLISTIHGCNNSSDDSSDDSDKTSQVAKPASKNLPGQEINSAKATKHEFYWTSKSDKKVRYFVNDDKKITAIKVVLGSEQNNTVWCQAILEQVLHDDDLHYGLDKVKEENTLLSNDGKYNIYSPKAKKWYWVRFDAGEGKDMVADFAIYPGKNKAAE